MSCSSRMILNHSNTNTQTQVQRNVARGFERKIQRHEDGSWTFEADESPDVGLYIETKRPSHYRSLGLGLEETLVRDIELSGFDGPVRESYHTHITRKITNTYRLSFNRSSDPL